MREEYRSYRDIGYLVPIWYHEENSFNERKALTGESAILCKEKQKIRSEDLSGDTDTNPWWLLAQMPQGEKKKRHTEGDLSCVLTLSQSNLSNGI